MNRLQSEPSIDSEEKRRESSGFWSRMKEKYPATAAFCSRIGERYMMAAAALVFTGVVGAAGCGGKTGLYDDYDAGTPVSDAEADSDSIDGGVPDGDMADGDVSDGDIPDSDVLDGDLDDGDLDSDLDSDTDGDGDTPVVPALWEGANLIGDYLNRELSDRSPNIPGDTNSEYPIGGPDTNENANPFTDGEGGSLGPYETFLHRISGEGMPLLADAVISDDDAGLLFVERQDIWLRGDNHFDSNADEVVGRLDFLAYSIRLDGPGAGEGGVPVCTESTADGDFSSCQNEGGDLDVATALHKLRINFLGEQWVVTNMSPPTDLEVSSDSRLANGGMIKLGREAASGIITPEDAAPLLTVDGYSFVLAGVETHGGERRAIIRVLDAAGTVIHMDQVSRGQTREFSIDGRTYMFHVYQLSPEYGVATWADCALLSREIELEDGGELDEDMGANPGFRVALGWKNKDSASGSLAPDSLRTVAIYSDDIADISTSGDNELLEGDYVSILQEPLAWRLEYSGLDTDASDYASLRFDIMTADLDIPASYGPIVAGAQRACLIYAPYVQVRSGAGGAAFSIAREDAPGELSDDEFLVALRRPDASARCDIDGDGIIENTDLYLTHGAVFMNVSPASSDYGYSSFYVQTVGYAAVGDGEIGFAPPAGGAILIQTSILTGRRDGAIGELLDTAGTGCGLDCIDWEGVEAGMPDVFFAVAEKAGVGASASYVGYHIFAIDGTGTGNPADATFRFDSFGTGLTQLTSDSNEILYGHATSNTSFYISPDQSGPFSSGLEMVDEGYVSERGSQVVEASGTRVELSMAQRVSRAIWRILGGS